MVLDSVLDSMGGGMGLVMDEGWIRGGIFWRHGNEWMGMSGGDTRWMRMGMDLGGSWLRGRGWDRGL